MTEIASHRGGALLWPENSRTAFENTAKLPVQQVEFDVHPSSDGRLVVIHDPTFDRTAEATGPVVDRSWAEIQQVLLKGTGGQRPLLLEELIGIFRNTDIALRCEIKVDAKGDPYPGLPRKVIESLASAHMTGRSVVTSFQLATVAEATGLAPLKGAVWLVSPIVLRDIGGAANAARLAEQQAIPAIGLHHSTLNPEVVAQVRDRGLGIGGWGCKTDPEMRKMFDLGVDVFTTDRPDLAIEIATERKRQS